MYLLDVKFLESSSSFPQKNYTYKSQVSVEEGRLVVVDVAGKAKLVIVQQCCEYLGNDPKNLDSKAFKWIRGTVNDQVWRDREKLKKTYAELKEKFEEEAEAYVKQHAIRQLIGNNPELLEMYNRLERMEKNLKEWS